jgi:hypothetical protein
MPKNRLMLIIMKIQSWGSGLRWTFASIPEFGIASEEK